MFIGCSVHVVLMPVIGPVILTRLKRLDLPTYFTLHFCVVPCFCYVVTTEVLCYGMFEQKHTHCIVVIRIIPTKPQCQLKLTLSVGNVVVVMLMATCNANSLYGYSLSILPSEREGQFRLSLHR
jgi:hypothetical protein